VAYAFALLAVLLVGAGYLLGLRRGLSREEALRSSLEERDEKLTIVEHELLRHTAVDPATGLHTQEYFQEFLEREWRRASRERQSVAILMMEVDHLHALSERQGKPHADACLKGVATALKPLIHRPGDVMARYGGPGKFGVVLGATDAKGALTMAEKLRMTVESLKMPNPASPSAPFLTLTLGVAAATPDREAAWQDIELIAAAERALSQARESGRNTVVLDTGPAPITSPA